MTTRYGFKHVGAVDVFYREAGPPDAPAILLLHGFPTASHMFRDLIPLLADRFRLIAPDLPGFGQTKVPPRGTFDFTFNHLADVIEDFTGAMSLDRYALYPAFQSYFREHSPRFSPSGDVMIRRFYPPVLPPISGISRRRRYICSTPDISRSKRQRSNRVWQGCRAVFRFGRRLASFQTPRINFT